MSRRGSARRAPDVTAAVMRRLGMSAQAPPQMRRLRRRRQVARAALCAAAAAAGALVTLAHLSAGRRPPAPRPLTAAIEHDLLHHARTVEAAFGSLRELAPSAPRDAAPDQSDRAGATR